MNGIEGVPEGWILTYRELSNNIYEVRLLSKHGSLFEMTGSGDFEGLVARCIKSANEINNQVEGR